MKIQLFTLCALSAVWLSTVGCNKQSEQAEPQTARNSTADEGAMMPASRTAAASERIADARCERERTCSNIGDNKTYSSTADCHARIRSDWKDDLNARECPGGIEQKELDECLAQIRAERCGNPFDTLSRMTECTAGQICVTNR